MKGRPPSRKKVLLQRYYSDSALQLSSLAKPAPTPSLHKPAPAPSLFKPNHSPSFHSHSFASPNPVGSHHSPRHHYSNSPRPSPRAVPFPSPLALKSSPLTNPISPRQRTSLLRSPVTPRDLRNAAILPPSPGSKNRVPCSPMGPVGRSLLASPASPRSPMDLSVRPTFRHHGRSPLASRALNLPPSPITSTDSNSPKPHPLSKNSETSSPLLRAYLANNKSRIFKPIPSSGGEGVTVIGLEGGSTTPPPTPGATRPDSASSSATELDGIFCHSEEQSKPQSLVRLPSIDTPMDFSSLLKDSRFAYRGPSSARHVTPTSLVTPTFLDDKH